MIENCRKAASLGMIESIASGFNIDSPELFSMVGFPSDILEKYEREIIEEIEEAAEEVLEEKREELEGIIPLIAVKRSMVKKG
jgi:vacuolar-type H+-ATPase subunit I/STV1